MGALDLPAQKTICYKQGGAHMNLATSGAVYVGLVMKTSVTALGEPIAGPRLMGTGRCSPAPGAMP